MATTETKFITNLKASNPEMNADRTLEIEAKTKLAYTRFVEDTQLKVDKLTRKALSDVSSGFKVYCSKSFIENDLYTQFEIKRLQEEIDFANARISYLF